MGIFKEMMGIGRSGEIVDEAFAKYYKSLRKNNNNSKDAFLVLSNEIYKNLLIYQKDTSYHVGVKSMNKETYNKLVENHHENRDKIISFVQTSVVYVFHDKYMGRPELITLLFDKINSNWKYIE